MVETLRWGIAGGGSIGAQMTRAVSALPGAHVAAVGSRSRERATAFAAHHGIPRAHGSYQALFDDPDIDIIYVASPHSSHCELTVGALEAGKHVLCEKAFAVNAEQARTMAETARRTGRFLMEAMWTWFLPPIRKVRDMVAAGEIGEVRIVQANFGLASPQGAGRHRELAQGGGALLDLGVYPVGLSRLILGQPTVVRALGHLGPTGVDVNVAGVLRHEGGALGVFHAGLDAFTTFTAEIIGTLGTIAIDPPFWTTSGFTVRRPDGDPMNLIDPTKGDRVDCPHEGLAHEAEHVMDRIRTGKLESDVIPLQTSVEVMETMDEIRRQIGLVYPEDR